MENPRDGGAWWAAVCGIAQSRTRLSDSLSFFFSKGILILYIIEKFYFEQMINFNSSRKYSQNDYLVQVFIKEILTCISIF